jgi:hypothetical protein
MPRASSRSAGRQALILLARLSHWLRYVVQVQIAGVKVAYVCARGLLLTPPEDSTQSPICSASCDPGSEPPLCTREQTGDLRAADSAAPVIFIGAFTL